MSSTDLSHPNPGQLIAFGLGRLPESEAAAIRSHLAVCPSCRNLLNMELGNTPSSQPGSGTDENPISPRPIPGPIHPEAPTQSPQAGPLPVGLENLPELIDHPRYRIIQLLGTGGMGAVFKAEHRLMERLVALKVISRSLIVSATAVERFRLEVKAAARLTHPNIVAAYDAEQAGDVHFLVMEFVEGSSLAQVVAKRGSLPIPYACDYIRQAALGLQHAHEQGMVHRDIKPHNLMLASKGRIKILDFGLARFVSEQGNKANLTAEGVVMGTPDYIAPEQAEDARRADVRADIYSLGCTLYYLLTGKPPFPKGTSMQKILAHFEQTPARVSIFRDDVPQDLIRILDQMMAKKPEDRYQTPIEIARAVAPLIKGAGTGESAPSSAKAEPDPAQVKTASSAKPVQVGARISDSKAATKTRSGALRIRGQAPKKPQRSRTEELQQFIRRHVIVIVPVVAVVLAIAFLVFYKLSKKDSHPPDARNVSPNSPFPAPPKRITKHLIFSKHTAPVSCVAYSPDDAHVASGDEMGKIFLMDFLKNDSRELKGHTQVIRSLSFSRPTGAGLLSGNDDKSMWLWDVATQKMETIFPHTESVCSVGFSKNGLEALSITSDGFCQIWNLRERKKVPDKRFPTGGAASSWTISPNGTKLGFGYFNGEVSYSDLNYYDDGYVRPPIGGQNAPYRFLRENRESLNCLAFSYDGQFLLSGGTDIRLWDLRNKILVKTFSGNSGRINCLACSPNNSLFLSGGEDKMVRLWDLTTGNQLCVFEGHSDAVTAVAFSPDGTRIVSGSKDKTLRFWDVP